MWLKITPQDSINPIILNTDWIVTISGDENGAIIEVFEDAYIHCREPYERIEQMMREGMKKEWLN